MDRQTRRVLQAFSRQLRVLKDQQEANLKAAAGQSNQILRVTNLADSWTQDISRITAENQYIQRQLDRLKERDEELLNFILALTQDRRTDQEFEDDLGLDDDTPS